MFAYCGNDPVNQEDSSGMMMVSVCEYGGGGGSKSTSSYNRANAVRYANTWYNARNSEYYSYSTDCANFVSQCLNAGGIKQTDSWHMKKTKKNWWYNPLAWFFSNYRYDWDVGSAWSKADDQYHYFKNNPHNSTLYVGPYDSISSVVSSNGIQAGDLLYFVENGTVHHATIISSVSDSMIYFAGHTKSRFDEPLSGHIDSGGVFIIMMGD